MNMNRTLPGARFVHFMHPRILHCHRRGQSKRQALCEWHELNGNEALWNGSASDEEAPSSRSLFAQGEEINSPFWRLILFSDGSVTRHLQLLTGSRVKVECLSMHNIGESLDGLPPGAEIIQGPRVQRQVLLQGTSQGVVVNLVYACSWWSADRVDEFLGKDKRKPIWVSLSEGQVEIYREIQYIHQGHNRHLEEVFQCKGPFFGRRYIFWHQSKPLTLIYEVFSPKLNDYKL